MGILDKAKDLISHATDRINDPDKDVVEKTWPAGQPDDEHLPGGEADSGTDVDNGDGQPVQPPQPTQPVNGADPELDDSIEDQYDPGLDDEHL
ncbi:hypothetical protein [Arthrobacter sp. NIO-1057]|uniref:hypothetical protein n=1 Tax=Arthrobacter sp. NIO-1057 TaxID=993071 RepID=UPI00071E45FD|nr:hypothetical protein [Arthrobacter sp. NIO-1057]KSU65951.1 hypothetical protein AS038_09685 [Arthrobacter sp. NIO-1057]SCC28342.1 hypothetical protein GA0061084_1970 [Arthrobacter sp. NIO-1057]